MRVRPARPPARRGDRRPLRRRRRQLPRPAHARLVLAGAPRLPVRGHRRWARNPAADALRELPGRRLPRAAQRVGGGRALVRGRALLDVRLRPARRGRPRPLRPAQRGGRRGRRVPARRSRALHLLGGAAQPPPLVQGNCRAQHRLCRRPRPDRLPAREAQGAGRAGPAPRATRHTRIRPLARPRREPALRRRPRAGDRVHGGRVLADRRPAARRRAARLRPALPPRPGGDRGDAGRPRGRERRRPRPRARARVRDGSGAAVGRRVAFAGLRREARRPDRQRAGGRRRRPRLPHAGGPARGRRRPRSHAARDRRPRSRRDLARGLARGDGRRDLVAWSASTSTFDLGPVRCRARAAWLRESQRGGSASLLAFDAEEAWTDSGAPLLPTGGADGWSCWEAGS